MHFEAKICASVFVSVVDMKALICLMFVWKENNTSSKCNVINMSNKPRKFRVFFFKWNNSLFIKARKMYMSFIRNISVAVC